MGLLQLWIVIYQAIRYKRCNVAITAVMEGSVGQSKWPIAHFIPVFRYKVSNRVYCQQSFIGYLPRQFKILFEVGREYTIYIDPQMPGHCVDKRKMPIAFLALMALIAVCFIFFGVICVFI